MMSRAGIFVVLVLWSLMTCSLGFTMNRSALVLSAWDTAPSLDTYQSISIDPVSGSKIQTTQDTAKFRQAEDVKMLTKVEDSMQKNQTLEKKSTTENIGAGIKLIGDVVSTAKNDDSDSLEETIGTVAAPRNVILLLIDDKDLDENRRENSWQERTETLPFTIKGSLQSCGDKIETTDISSESTLVSESKEKDCDCERLLYSNIGELLSWAKYTKQMATGTVSDNFTTPLLLDYLAGSSDILTGFDGFNERDRELELRKNKRDSSDMWQVIDLRDRAKPVPTFLAPEPKREEMMNYGEAWNIFDVFSKIRMAFFRSLLESLGRKDGTFEDKFSSRAPFPLIKPTVTGFIGNIIRELKFISKHKGYVLIAVVPRNERVAVINILQREISVDTLLVVTETCFGNKSTIPFVARGLNDQILRRAKTIWELPMAIKNAITGCQDLKCSNRQRRDVPAVTRTPIEISVQELPARKRVIRDKNDATKLSTTNIEETTIVEKQARSSTPPETKSYSPATLLGVATSLLAVAALTPS